MKNTNKGITLVELSIVLSIIGLLLAAVVGGMSIRKSSELHSFMTDITSFQVAIENFDAKYGALPGDMPDAYSYWGTNCVNIGDGNDADRCNGNGNGVMDLNGSGAKFTYPNGSPEPLMAWRHLILSEFLGGPNYTGLVGANRQSNLGIQVPASKRTMVGYEFINYTMNASNNKLYLIGFTPGSWVYVYPALTSLEAFTIDKKMDDGIPNTGNVLADDEGFNCLSIVGNAYINMTSTMLRCNLVFPVKP